MERGYHCMQNKHILPLNISLYVGYIRLLIDSGYGKQENVSVCYLIRDIANIKERPNFLPVGSIPAGIAFSHLTVQVAYNVAHLIREDKTQYL